MKKQAMLVLLCQEKSNHPITRQVFSERLNLHYASSQHYTNAVGKAIEEFRKRLE